MPILNSQNRLDAESYADVRKHRYGAPSLVAFGRLSTMTHAGTGTVREINGTGAGCGKGTPTVKTKFPCV